MSEADLVENVAFKKLNSRHLLDDEDFAAIRALPFERRTFEQGSHLVREGQQLRRCALLLDGYAYRQKLTADGHRALVSLQVPGDFVDLQQLFLDQADHDVQALTRVTAAEYAISDLRAIAVARPRIARSMWVDALVEGSISREWLLNVGRRTSRARLAHFLCEIAIRLQQAGLTVENSYILPMTQEQLGDTTGLTAVHVNRMLKSLEREGTIRREKRKVTILDWPAIRKVADFSERYLHVGQQVL